ncbi:ribonuclease H-like domain-containing protein [Gigaspora rosea]|uniref:DNA polymerase delta catalytic subunit n=1 Tax=Gigaspora rosea TaxID=44941 RepID=A0A397ULU1_9GLOM|nr:ribonuclease H-like domain-containing protein [Gigaspora rosea]
MSRSEIVATFEITDPNLFFVYEAVDESNYDNGYLLRLYSVLENGQKFFIDIIKYDLFFDIKLKDPSLLNSYLEEFRDNESYNVINKQPFDSTKKFYFLRIYFSNHQKCRKALQSLKNKIENLNEELQKIRDSKKTKKKIDVVREHDFELVGWHRLKSAWDIECESKRGPVFFPVAEQPDDYIYMIQLDIFLYNQFQPLKRYNITSLPINTSLFFEKYGNEKSCSPNEFDFVLVNSEEEILLEFAKLNYLYQKDIEIGYNTGGFDWPFVLKKAELLGILDEFSQQLLGSIFLDLLVWAKKIFQNELKHTLAYILKKCKLSGKVDLSYIPDDNSDNLKCIFVYVLAIKFQNNELLLSEFATKLSKLCKIDYQKCFNAMSDSSVLEEYVIDLAYYCSVDTLCLQELLIKQNIVGDYMQLAKISSITISNVFMNAVGTVINNFFGRNAQKQDMLFSMTRKGIIEIVPYEGALVLEKKNSDKPMGVLDFASMYPNTIIEKIFQLIRV